MRHWHALKPGDTVDLIAPASRCDDKLLEQIKELLTSWKLRCHVPANIFGKDVICSNTDAIRFQQLKEALLNHSSKAVICVRGGYGSARLIPMLKKVQAPLQAKLFIGMSDITALHVFLQQKWNWCTVHAGFALDKFTIESINRLKPLMFGETSQINLDKLIALNASAKKEITLEAQIIGGNLSLVQASIGTSWQINPKDKFLLLEDVNERGFRVDRMLEHLKQSGVFSHVKALLLGDFSKGEEPDGSSKVEAVLEQFAKECDFPVLRVDGVGHGPMNIPVALGTESHLHLGKKPNLVYRTGNENTKY